MYLVIQQLLYFKLIQSYKMPATYKEMSIQILPDGRSLESDYVFRIQKDVEGTTIVSKTSNSEYLAWLAEGNTPEPADEPETE